MPDTIPHIRPEHPGDADAIRDVERAAFTGHPHHPPGSDAIEPRIVDRLRDDRALTLSLVAEVDAQVVGHIAFSPVLIDGASGGWYGLGPLAVRPDHQRRGIGAALITDGLERLRTLGAAGVVLVGDEGYYGRFGFARDAGLTFDGVPAEYFLCRPLGDRVPVGAVTYHAAFFIS